MKILDGRGSFYQWDLGQKLLVEDERVEQLHFATAEENALVCPVYEKDGLRVADVPNILLQAEGVLKVFAAAGDRTLYARSFRVNPKEKPDDYIYTETEVWTAETAVEQALTNARESGEFDGPPGPKGDPGVVKFTVVNELPEEDAENAIYLVPISAGAEDNLFHEYIFIDGKWEKIGSAAVQVDLTDYVKNTDYANHTKHGVVKVEYVAGGLYVISGGILRVYGASKSHIDLKASRNIPITTDVVDYAVKVGVTTNTEILTEEEKSAACGWLGTGVILANEDGSLSVKLADGNTYRIAATKEE